MSDANVDPGVAGAASDPAGAVPASPEQHAKTIIDPNHPEAGKGGVVPPAAYRFPPGQSANPGGRLRGSFSVRRAAQRRAARDWESDAECPEGEQPIGAEARKLADELIEAAFAGDTERVKAITATIAELEGKPQERVENTGGLTVKRIIIDGDAA